MPGANLAYTSMNYLIPILLFNTYICTYNICTYNICTDRCDFIEIFFFLQFDKMKFSDA